ncbi:MAG: uracil phosphoribosyltransferase, partial [Rikenellaceae bacterium]
LERIGELIAYRVSERLDYRIIEVQTPLAKATASEPADRVVLGTILRASLPMYNGMLNIFDAAENAFITAYRNYVKGDQFEIVVEYVSTPDITDKVLLLADPMLASGESMAAVYRAICKKAGVPRHTHIISAIATEQGINYLKKYLDNENITIWCAAVDLYLNAHSYIVPGLGDAGDLAFGSKLK